MQPLFALAGAAGGALVHPGFVEDCAEQMGAMVLDRSAERLLG